MKKDLKIKEKKLLRMKYNDEIKYIKENKIWKDDGYFYEFGEDINEMKERMMKDKIKKKIMMWRFKVEIK